MTGVGGSPPLLGRCPACNEPLSTTIGFSLLPCLHPLCKPCLDAELGDSPSGASCVYTVEDGLFCNEPFATYPAAQEIVPVATLWTLSASPSTSPASSPSTKSAPGRHVRNSSVGSIGPFPEDDHLVPTQLINDVRERGDNLSKRLPELTRAIKGLEDAVTTLREHRATRSSQIKEHFARLTQQAHRQVDRLRGTTAGQSVIAAFSSYLVGLFSRTTAEDISRPIVSPSDKDGLLPTPVVDAGIADAGIAHVEPPNMREAFSEQFERRRDEVLTELNGAIQRIAADIKLLQEQRDQLLVMQGHYYSVLQLIKMPQCLQSRVLCQVARRRADQLLSTHLGMSLAAPTLVDVHLRTNLAGHNDTIESLAAAVSTTIASIILHTRPLLVHGVNHLSFSWQARDYTRITQPGRRLGSHSTGPRRLSTAQGLALTSEGHLVIADSDHRRLLVLNSQGRFVKSVRTSSIIYGVAVTAAGDFWTGERLTDSVLLYDSQSGQVLRTVPCPDAFGLAILPDQALAVGCWAQNKVVVYEIDGSMRWSSTGNGFKMAVGLVAVPEENLLIVCDFLSHRLQVLSLSTGRYLRSITGHGLYRPMSVAYDSIARLLIVGEFDNISAWTLRGTLVHRWGTGDVRRVSGVAVQPVLRHLAGSTEEEPPSVFVCDQTHSHFLAY